MHKLRDASCEAPKDLKAELKAIAGDSRIYVLGLGNTDRADDGAGILVAEELKKFFPSHSYSEHDGVEGTVLDISEKNEDATVFFVDSSELGKKPGTIEVVGKEHIRDREITTHRVPVALMSSVLDKAGIKSAVICVQPASIEFRGDVSPSVRVSVEAVAKALKELMANANN